ncbi:MAG: class II glutamine amidotransferase [Gemmatimonadota bacterium]|nr:class II glutamine amidotransferase [Gemmatimonadota bacterium]
MCNLYGFRSTAATKVDCALVQAQDAKMILSDEPKPTGWGIVAYDGPAPKLERRAIGAKSDLSFGIPEASQSSKTFLAHLRYSTVGRPSIANTQPFTYGRWAFAHDGTFWKFREFESELLKPIDPNLLQHRKGKSDSEIIFLWILSHLQQAGFDLGQAIGSNIEHAFDVISESLGELERVSTVHGAVRKPRLTFILTDGVEMFTAAWRTPLFRLYRSGEQICPICGESHIAQGTDSSYRSVSFASEPITDEDWLPLPDIGLQMVDRELEIFGRTVAA